MPRLDDFTHRVCATSTQAENETFNENEENAGQVLDGLPADERTDGRGGFEGKRVNPGHPDQTPQVPVDSRRC
jgi:hypothetical protein